MSRFTRRLATLGLAAAAAFAVFTASPAAAASGDEAVAPCSSHTFTRPFTPWLDIFSYTLAPGGNFEAGGASWDLRGGASVVNGNEPYRVGGSGDSRALRLPGGASATSPKMCVNLLYPTMRFFAKGDAGLITGLLTSRLKVEVVYTDLFGVERTAPVIAVALNGTGWEPSLPAPLLVNIGTILSHDGTADVAFRFTAVGGSWSVDDVYVDPFRAR
jgi:hypothetical protein